MQAAPCRLRVWAFSRGNPAGPGWLSDCPAGMGWNWNPTRPESSQATISPTNISGQFLLRDCCKTWMTAREGRNAMNPQRCSRQLPCWKVRARGLVSTRVWSGRLSEGHKTAKAALYNFGFTPAGKKPALHVQSDKDHTAHVVQIKSIDRNEDCRGHSTAQQPYTVPLEFHFRPIFHQKN